MKCPKCGFEINKKENFCPYCGEKLEDKVEVEIVENEEYTKEDIEKNKVYALFSYFGFLFIIPLIAAPNSKYAKFHANQGIILCILNAVSSLLVELFEKFTSLHHAGALIVDGIMVCFTIYGVYNAVSGKAKQLPIIGNCKILK